MRRDHHFSKILMTGLLFFAVGFILAGCDNQSIVNNFDEFDDGIYRYSTTIPSSYEYEIPTEIPKNNGTQDINFPDYDFLFIAIDNSQSSEYDPNLFRYKLAQFYLSFLKIVHTKFDLDMPVLYFYEYSENTYSRDLSEFTEYKIMEEIEQSAIESDPGDELYFYENIIEDFSLLQEERQNEKGKLIIFTDGIWDIKEAKLKDYQNNFIDKIEKMPNFNNASIEVIITNPQALTRLNEVFFWNGIDDDYDNIDVFCLPEGRNSNGERNPLDVEKTKTIITNWIVKLTSEYNIPDNEWIILNDENEDIDFSWYTSKIEYDFTPITWITSSQEEEQYWPSSNHEEYQIKLFSSDGTKPETLDLKYLDVTDTHMPEHSINWVNAKNCTSEKVTIKPHQSSLDLLTFLWIRPIPIKLSYSQPSVQTHNLESFDLELSSLETHKLDRLSECLAINFPLFGEEDTDYYSFSISDSHQLTTEIQIHHQQEIAKIFPLYADDFAYRQPLFYTISPCDTNASEDCKPTYERIDDSLIQERIKIEYSFSPLIIEDTSSCMSNSEEPDIDFDIHVSIELDPADDENPITIYKIDVPTRFLNPYFSSDDENKWKPNIEFISDDCIFNEKNTTAEYQENPNINNNTEFEYTVNEDYSLISIYFGLNSQVQGSTEDACNKIKISWTGTSYTLEMIYP